MVTKTKKIFVGGLSAATTLEEVKAYFQRFGEVNVPKYTEVKRWNFANIVFIHSNIDKQNHSMSNLTFSSLD